MTKLEKKLRIILFQPLVDLEYEEVWLHEDAIDRLVNQIMEEFKKWKT